MVGGAFPFELFAVQAIYRRCTGHEVSLEADQPLAAKQLNASASAVPLIRNARVPKAASICFANLCRLLAAIEGCTAGVESDARKTPKKPCQGKQTQEG